MATGDLFFLSFDAKVTQDFASESPSKLETLFFMIILNSQKKLQ